MNTHKTRNFPVQFWRERKLIWTLAKNDFKKKFAGAYLGVIWAMVQPLVTVLVYWFVFQVALPQRASLGAKDVPFILWMLAGLVPWFYFQEFMVSGTNVLLEYSYLVKKVVFQIEILPMVKMVSAAFIHGFFVCVTLLLFCAYGSFSGLYLLQVLYYTAAMMIMTLGICYAASAVTVFFRDLVQIVNIGLQIGVWMTPIMWNMDSLGVPAVIRTLLKLNPMYYIVYGYRDALIYKVWFWEHPALTLYFWCFTILTFWLGAYIFKRLRMHFADVL